MNNNNTNLDSLGPSNFPPPPPQPDINHNANLDNSNIPLNENIFNNSFNPSDSPNSNDISEESLLEATRQQANSLRRKDIRKEHKKSVLLVFFRDILFVFIAAAIFSVIIKTFILQPFIIPSESMRNTFLIDDRIITNKLKPSFMKLSRGDIVVFKDTQNWLPQDLVESEKTPDTPITSALKFVGIEPEDNQGYLVKRVIGISGDRVSCKGIGAPIMVNGVAINEPYLKPGVTPSSVSFDVTVPEGSIWVMGDNRSNSSDSRYNRDKPNNGFIQQKDVVGVAFAIYWPTHRAKLLNDERGNFKEVQSN